MEEKEYYIKLKIKTTENVDLNNIKPNKIYWRQINYNKLSSWEHYFDKINMIFSFKTRINSIKTIEEISNWMKKLTYIEIKNKFIDFDIIDISPL